MRLIGFGVSGLSESLPPEPQLQLFPDPDLTREERDARLDSTLDHLRDKLGEGAVMRGSRLG